MIKDSNLKYLPTPIDTSNIELPSELIPLLEKIAENVHDIWARNRLSEGWKYGEKRDENKKEHPCLVPYMQLSNKEKDYDRATAQESLKLILKLGFRILPPI